MNQLEQFFKEKSIRLTDPRREVYDILNSKEQPLTISEILKLSRISERTSIYRTLELFTSLGIIEALQLKGKIRYELAEPFKPHHHHLVCVACGELIPLDNTKLEKTIQHLADGHRYTLTAHHVELQGICHGCHIQQLSKVV